MDTITNIYKHGYKNIDSFDDKEKLYDAIQGITGLVDESYSMEKRLDLAHDFYLYLLDTPRIKVRPGSTPTQVFNFLTMLIKRFDMMQRYENNRRLIKQSISLGMMPTRVSGIEAKMMPEKNFSYRRGRPTILEHMHDGMIMVRSLECSEIKRIEEEMDYKVVRAFQRRKIRKIFKTVTGKKSYKFNEVLKLYFKGLTADEIARKMDVNVEAIYLMFSHRITKAKKLLGKTHKREKIFVRDFNLPDASNCKRAQN